MSNYVTLVEAQTYFDGRLGTDAWDSATDIDRTKALTMATKAINTLNFQGEKTDPVQTNQFPRDGDTVVPQEIKDATCEVALALLDGKTVEEEYERNRISSERYSTVGVTYNGAIPQEYIINGIMSITAWMLLKPFMRDPRSIDIIRI